MPKQYNIRPTEERGKNPDYYEPRIVLWFWKEHIMDEAITWTAEELDAKVNAFMDAYQERQLKLDAGWWYPESPRLQKKRPQGY
jgi:hypothetical protein